MIVKISLRAPLSQEVGPQNTLFFATEFTLRLSGDRNRRRLPTLFT